MRAQASGEEAIGFGEITLGASINSLTLTCLELVVCEDSYDSVWVRVRHGDGVVQAVEVVYSGKKKTGEPVTSSPITLAQAIRMHSIRNGHRAPRLAFGGTRNGNRVIVDVANGIGYVADGAFESSLVKEVRYVPITDPLIEAASGSPLTENGARLLKAARATRFYRNLLAEGESGGAAQLQGGHEFSADEIRQRVEKMCVEVRDLARATLMLSEHVSRALERKSSRTPRLRRSCAIHSHCSPRPHSRRANGWMSIPRRWRREGSVPCPWIL